MANRFQRALQVALGSEGKALTASDYVTTEPPVYNPHPGRRVSSRTAGQHLQAYGGTEAIDWVRNAVDFRAHATSAAGFEFRKRDGKLVEARRTEETEKSARVAPEALVELLEYPNPWWTWIDLVEMTVIDQLLTGDAFWLKYRINDDGQPMALYRLPPWAITVVPGTKKLVDRYEYQVPGAAKPLVYQPHQIIHFKLPNPHDEHLGLGLIKGGAKVYDTELNITDATLSFYERGAQLSGVLQSDRQVPPTAMTKIRRAMRSIYQGSKNAGEVAILERGMKFASVQPERVHEAFGPIADQSRDRVLAMLGTPRPLIIYDGDDPRIIRESERLFAKYTMRPYLDRFQETISQHLTRAWDLDLHIPYEYQMPPEDAIALATNLATLPGVTVREVREQAGLEPSTGDAAIDDTVLNLPGDNENESEVKDRNLAGEAGRPPNPENTAAIDANAPKRKDAQAVSTQTVPNGASRSR